MQEELGDVLMQVAFHAVIEEERGRFTFEDVCREVCEKLVFRHPNIFASSAAQNAGINGWDALKNREKGRTTLADELGHSAGYAACFDACPEAAEACRPLRGRAVCAGNGTAGFAGSTGRLEPGTGRTGGGRTAVCCGQCHAAGWCGRGGSADLCIQSAIVQNCWRRKETKAVLRSSDLLR